MNKSSSYRKTGLKALTTCIALAIASTSALAETERKVELGSAQFADEFYDKSIQMYSDDTVSNIGREQWIDKRFPITPSDVKQYIQKSSQLEKSFKTNLDTKLIKRSLAIDPENPQSFPEIIVANGFDSIVTFWDASGKPWPVEYFGNGNKNQFTVLQPQDISSKNMITISSSKNFSRTTLTVKFLNETSPLVIQLATSDIKGSDEADGIVSIRLQKRGPMATEIDPVIIDKSSRESVATSNIMLKFLDNLPPKKAVLVNLPDSSNELKVWSYNDEVFIRTKHNLIWPPAQSVQNGEGEVKVYKTTVSPMIRLSMKYTGQSKNYKVVSYGR